MSVVASTSTGRVAAGETVRTEWLAHISFDAAQIAGSFSVGVYLDGALVGAVAAFGGTAPKPDSTVSGNVPLTQALLDANADADAAAYVKRALAWRISKVSVRARAERCGG